VVEVEVHDEVVDCLDGLTASEWDRVVVIIDRLADSALTLECRCHAA
jgi:hypothetical protein